MSENFTEKIQAEKQKHIANLAGEKSIGVSREDIAKHFQDAKISPETIANFLKMIGKNGDYIE